jgi:LCP family protein required for cell wall assembly
MGDEPPRGNIIPFPAAAIRRPPSPTFVTQPVRAPRVPPRGRLVLAWLAAGSVLAALFVGFLLAIAASRAAHRRELLSGNASRVPFRATVPGSVNLLIAGLDADDGTPGDAAVRSDAILLLHLDADRGRACLVSIPRDVRVTVPGHGERCVEDATLLGGPVLLVATLERLTRLPIDHVALFDRSGLRRLTDGIGGVALALDPPVGIDRPGAGLALELSGAMVVDYVHGPGSASADDLEHIRREHRYLRALFAQLDARGTLADSAAVGDLAASLGSSVHVDAALAPSVLKSLLASTRRLRREDVTLVTAPVVSSPPAFVHPDADGCAQLWDALARDDMPAFVAAHPEWVSTGP